MMNIIGMNKLIYKTNILLCLSILLCNQTWCVFTVYNMSVWCYEFIMTSLHLLIFILVIKSVFMVIVSFSGVCAILAADLHRTYVSLILFSKRK